MMHTVRVIPLILLLAATAAAHGPGHPGQYDTALLAPTLPDALELAAGESKLVCVWATEKPDTSCLFLHWPSESTEPLFDLLIQQCVIVELNMREHGGALGPFVGDSLPALLLLDSGGREVRRLSGNLTPRRLLGELTAEFACDETLARDRAALVQCGEDHFFTRDRLARTLIRRGENAEALEHIRFLLGRCIDSPGPAARARRPAVLGTLGELALNDSAARAAAVRFRAQVSEYLLAGKGGSELAHDLAHLNAVMGEPLSSLELFDRLESGSAARIGLHEHVFDALMKRRRYLEALGHLDPGVAFRGEAALARKREITRLAPIDVPRGRGSRHFALSRGAALLEALAGTRRGLEATGLIDEILDFDERPGTVRMLEEHLRRAENPVLMHELMRHLAERTGKGRTQK